MVGMRKLFPSYATRATRVLSYVSWVMVWPGCLATLFIHRGDPAAPFLRAWLVVGLLASFGALGAMYADSRRAKP